MQQTMSPGVELRNTVASGLLTCAGLYLLTMWLLQPGARAIVLRNRRG
jgi:hypothetical protein